MLMPGQMMPDAVGTDRQVGRLRAVDYWALELRSEQLAQGHAALGDAIDQLATALDEVGGAQGTRVSCNLDQRTVKAHFFVRAGGFAAALDEGLAIFERAVAGAEVPQIPVARAQVARTSARQAPDASVRLGLSSHVLERHSRS